jgi:uncharacterized protein YqgC (DUF456 family)
VSGIVSANVPRPRAAFAFVFVTVLLDMLAIGIVVPVLPRLIVDFIGPELFTATFAFFIGETSLRLPGAPFLLAAALLVVAIVTALKVAGDYSGWRKDLSLFDGKS